ncbi:MAG: valine--tRNA ligase, partial [Firmicutes bacterium]|nr:valine--tRNA ligase [Bacillota bacterium]
KITPAHDPNDYEVAKRHGSDCILILNEDGTVNGSGGAYAGMDRFAARDKIVADLQAAGLLAKVQNYAHEVGHCYRCAAVVEPMTSDQWFVKMEALAKPAIDIVKSGGVRMTPKRFEKVYFHWMNNIRDWCISRQLWWGHRIPAYYCTACGHIEVSADEITACGACGAAVTRDESVLDTWFSSALWPFSTLGFPDKTEDLGYFFPTDTLVTAQDIIFFWVARMIFSSLKFTGKPPFRDVVFNGLVRDKAGKKMSKSAGNGIDPLDLIDKYGADALRFSLLFGTSHGKDFRFSYEKVENDRTFINKIWNAARFALAGADSEIPPFGSFQPSAVDKYILHKLNDTARKVNRAMDKFDLPRAVNTLYAFVWNDFCDWYIEFSKCPLYGDDPVLKGRAQSVLLYVLDKILKLLHPFLPFVTEEIYGDTPGHAETVMLEQYPEYDPKLRFPREASAVNKLIELVKSIRNLRAEMKIPPSKRSKILLTAKNGNAKILKEFLPQIEKLAGGSSCEIIGSAPAEQCLSVITELCEAYLPAADLVDREKERARLAAELKVAEAELARAEGKVNNPTFVANAPAALVETERAKAQKYAALAARLREQMTE